jgi:peptidoglycan hydrolase CwlO-like protein
MKEELEKKKAELEKQREQLIANLNFISGQLALIEELISPKPKDIKEK